MCVYIYMYISTYRVRSTWMSSVPGQSAADLGAAPPRQACAGPSAPVVGCGCHSPPGNIDKGRNGYLIIEYHQFSIVIYNYSI